MTKRTCLTCGTIFEDSISLFTCATCKQTKAITKLMKEQAEDERQRQYNIIQQQPAPIYTRGSYYPGEPRTYVPPTPEEARLRKKFRRIDSLLKLLLGIFPFAAAFILWIITSGWVTFFAFISIPFMFKILFDQHWYWQVKHSEYLFKT